MARIQLDYQRDVRPVPWAGVFLLGLALLAGAWLLGLYLDQNQQLAYWQTRVMQIEALAGGRQPARPGSDKDKAAQTLEVLQAKKVLRELALPWGAMFRAVEASGDKTVALLSMEPDPAKGTVRISGEAKDFAAMLEYVRQLGARDEFSKVLLQNHHVNVEDRERPIRFSVLTEWKVVAP